MGMINLASSIKYGPHGKRRKTKAFTVKSKRAKYNELIQEQQKIYEQVMVELSNDYPSFVGESQGAITPRKEPMQYTGERKLLVLRRCTSQILCRCSKKMKIMPKTWQT